jgi:hypothetical protein
MPERRGQRLDPPGGYRFRLTAEALLERVRLKAGAVLLMPRCSSAATFGPLLAELQSDRAREQRARWLSARRPLPLEATLTLDAAGLEHEIHGVTLRRVVF